MDGAGAAEMLADRGREHREVADEVAVKNKLDELTKKIEVLTELCRNLMGVVLLLVVVVVYGIVAK